MITLSDIYKFVSIVGIPYTVYMPRVTQYIRNEDLDKWNALNNKSEFIHNALNPSENIKVNKDGTISPKVPGRPFKFTNPMKTNVDAIKQFFPEAEPIEPVYKKTQNWGA